jgi:hypothetical protein
MPTADTPAPDASANERDGLEALWQLAAKGAYATPADPSCPTQGDYAVFSPRNGFAQPVAIIAAVQFTRARSRGWVEPERTGGAIGSGPPGSKRCGRRSRAVLRAAGGSDHNRARRHR